MPCFYDDRIQLSCELSLIEARYPTPVWGFRLKILHVIDDRRFHL